MKSLFNTFVASDKFLSFAKHESITSSVQPAYIRFSCCKVKTPYIRVKEEVNCLFHFGVMAQSLPAEDSIDSQ